ncbi:MAG TPA: hypothetical protein VHB02_13735 [Acidimicrobiales bacterium]|nr:hypothetical protein [Acidimicrobiales bacterium]
MPAGMASEEHRNDGGASIEARLAALERSIGAMATEITTGRLVVVDARGRPRLVAEVLEGTVELRVELPDRDQDGRPPADDPVRTAGRTAAVLYATPAGGGVGGGGELGLGPSVGLQLWADGDAVAELDAWPDGDGRWQAHLHPTGDP